MKSRKDCGLYGDFRKCKASEIQKTKDLLLEEMINTVRELAKRDDFFIIKTPADIKDDPLCRDLKLTGFLVEGEITVGWKICFPQMKE